MTELETRLIALLKASEEESRQREKHLLARIDDLQRLVLDLTKVVDASTQQVDQLAGRQNTLIEHYNKVVDLLNEELQQ